VSRRLRITQVSPLDERVPPALYGGTERVVDYLTEELVARGHRVTLFASGDSCTKAKLVAPASRALRLEPVLPPWLDWVEIRDLGLGASRLDVAVSRGSKTAAVELLCRRGDAELVVRR